MLETRSTKLFSNVTKEEEKLDADTNKTEKSVIEKMRDFTFDFDKIINKNRARGRLGGSVG